LRILCAKKRESVNSGNLRKIPVRIGELLPSRLKPEAGGGGP
jgi:hypothetical protein